MKSTFSAITIFFFIFTSAFATLTIMTSIPPLGYMIQQLAGDTAKVEFLVKPGDNPHNYNLTPRQVVEISKADIFVSLGLQEDVWILKKVVAINPKIKIVKATKGMMRFLIGTNDNYNPHVWLDVKLYEMMCVNIYHELTNFMPRNKNIFSANFSKLILKLEDLNDEITEKMNPFHGRNFIAQHPAWDYFARAYGLGKEFSLVNDSGQAITPREYKNILDSIKQYKINSIIGDPVTPSKMAYSLATESRIKIVEINPVYLYNYFDLMKNITKKFAEALQ